MPRAASNITRSSASRSDVDEPGDRAQPLLVAREDAALGLGGGAQREERGDGLLGDDGGRPALLLRSVRAREPRLPGPRVEVQAGGQAHGVALDVHLGGRGLDRACLVGGALGKPHRLPRIARRQREPRLRPRGGRPPGYAARSASLRSGLGLALARERLEAGLGEPRGERAGARLEQRVLREERPVELVRPEDASHEHVLEVPGDRVVRALVRVTPPPARRAARALPRPRCRPPAPRTPSPATCRAEGAPPCPRAASPAHRRCTRAPARPPGPPSRPPRRRRGCPAPPPPRAPGPRPAGARAPRACPSGSPRAPADGPSSACTTRAKSPSSKAARATTSARPQRSPSSPARAHCPWLRTTSAASPQRSAARSISTSRSRDAGANLPPSTSRSSAARDASTASARRSGVAASLAACSAEAPRRSTVAGSPTKTAAKIARPMPAPITAGLPTGSLTNGVPSAARLTLPGPRATWGGTTGCRDHAAALSR